MLKRVKDFISDMSYSAEVTILLIIIFMLWLVTAVALVGLAVLPIMISPLLGLISVPASLWIAVTILIRSLDKY